MSKNVLSGKGAASARKLKKVYQKEIFIAFVSFIIAISFGFFVESNTPTIKIIPPPSPKKEVDSFSIERKRELLETNYYIKLEQGRYAYDQKEYRYAIKEFFHAKSIYPLEFQPRYNLCKSFYSLCQEEGRYCGNAIREIKNAFGYIPTSDQSKIHELIEMDLWLKTRNKQMVINVSN